MIYSLLLVLMLLKKLNQRFQKNQHYIHIISSLKATKIVFGLIIFYNILKFFFFYIVVPEISYPDKVNRICVTVLFCVQQNLIVNNQQKELNDFIQIFSLKKCQLFLLTYHFKYSFKLNKSFVSLK